MTRLRSVPVVYGAIAILAGAASFSHCSGTGHGHRESLPKAVRSGALAIIYGVAVSVFGGTTQFAIKALTDLTGNPLTPAWYMTGAVIVGGVAMALMQETAPVKSRFTAGA